EIARLLGDGKKIEAIKVYRQVYGVGLKEAKDAVEAYESGQFLPRPTSPYAPPIVIPSTTITSGTYSNTPRPKSFIGTWFGLSFGFFWVGFTVAMLSLFAFPGLVRLTAPVMCPEGYTDAYGQRV